VYKTPLKFVSDQYYYWEMGGGDGEQERALSTVARGRSEAVIVLPRDKAQKEQTTKLSL